MVATRAGVFDGRFFSPFPRALQNTALSPAILNATKYARSIINMIPNRKLAGSGSLRFGMGDIAAPRVNDITEGWEYRRSDGTLEQLIYTDDGQLWRLYNNVYTSLKTGLNVNGSIDAVQFNGKLIFWNGLDPNFSYDGTNLTDLGEYVTDYDSVGGYGSSSSPLWVANNQISLVVNPARSDYPIGRPIRVTFATSGSVNATVQSTNLVGNVLTITVAGTPFPASTQVILRVEYFDKPQPFSFIYATNDKLFALSGGLLRPRVYRGNDSLKFFYTTTPNNENSWFSQGSLTSTQNVAFQSVQNKAGIFDELVGISSLNNLTVFHGRQQLYIYQGYDPLVPGDFIWIKNIPVGTVHGKLIQKMPNDVAFVTPFGIRSLAITSVTEDSDVRPDIGSDVDSTVSAKLFSVMSDDEAYRAVRSFYYPRDGQFGFKLDSTSLLVYVVNEESKGWTEFTGYFADAAAFIPLSDSRFLIGRGTQLYAYGNGTDPDVGEIYNDNGQAIMATWWVPWLSANARWGNRTFEILLENTVNTTFTLDRMLDYNERNVTSTDFTVIGVGSQWDVSMWDVDTWDASTINPMITDKFIADKAFSMRLTFSAVDGPVNVLGIRPIGR